MSTNDKIFSQLVPTAGITTILYTVPQGAGAFGTLFCSNTDGANSDILRVALVPSTAALDDSMYILYDAALYQYQPLYLQQLGLNSGDSIVIDAKNGTTSFTFTGQLFST